MAFQIATVLASVGRSVTAWRFEVVACEGSLRDFGSVFGRGKGWGTRVGSIRGVRAGTAHMRSTAIILTSSSSIGHQPRRSIRGTVGIHVC
jgi:hypothetical protein